MTMVTMLLAVAILTVFWGFQAQITGYVSMVNGISRVWDIILIPSLIAMASWAWAVTHRPNCEVSNLKGWTAFIVGCSAIVGMIFVMPFGVYGIILGGVVALSAGAFVGVSYICRCLAIRAWRLVYSNSTK